MKFAYLDETGSADQSDTFVMTAVLVDAYRLRKYTSEFDRMIDAILAQHPGLRKELKTKRMINGEGGWSKIDAEERKKFLAQICDLANECSRIFAIAFSLRGFNAAVDGSYGHPFAKSYRRRIELMTENERWKGERDYFESLGARLPTHERVGRNPGGLCIDFYKAAQSKYWTL